MLLTSATIAALAVLAAIYFLNVRVVITDEEVVVRGMTGRERRWPRHAVQGCLLFAILFYWQPTKVVVVHGPDDHFLFSLLANMWDDRAVRRLTETLGYRHAGTTNFHTTYKEELLARYPRALPFRYRHFWAVGIFGGLLFTVTAIAIGVILINLLQPS